MNYLITQRRSDAIGQVQESLKKGLADFKVIEIPWVKFMPLSHLIELFYVLLFSFRLKGGDLVLSCNSKSIHTHLLPYLCSAELYMIHFHFDEKPLLLHKIPFFSYEKLFNQWFTIFATKSVMNKANRLYPNIKSDYSYCGIDHSIFNNKNLKRDKNIILYVGSFAPRKNINNTLRAFKLHLSDHPSSKLVIIKGYGKDELDFWDLIADLELYNKVFIKREVDLKELVYWYNKAGCFVFPTLIEGFGLPLVESVACGVPVVTSDRDVHREITRDKQIYVEPTNPVSIKDGIEKALKVKDNYCSVTNIYTFDKFISKIRKIMVI